METSSRTLKIFCAVADAGSLHLAAQRVGLSVSAMSRMMTRLEADLGVDLFDRRERRMALTAAGRRFLGRAREAVTLLGEIAEFGRRTDVAAPLRVAAFSRHAETIVAPALVDASRADPGFGPFKLEVHAQRDFAFSRVARPFDVGFGHLAGRPDGYDIQALASSPIVVVVPPHFAFAVRGVIGAKRLAELPVILLAGDTIIGRIVRDAVGAAALRVVAEASHTYAALRLVQEGLGVHVTDKLAARSAVESGCRIVPLAGRHAAPSISAFWPKRPDGTAARIEAAIDAVRRRLNSSSAPRRSGPGK